MSEEVHHRLPGCPGSRSRGEEGTERGRIEAPGRVPEYAGELFDQYRKSPELFQLLQNEALYYGAGPVPHDETRVGHYQAKIGVLEAGQASGHVTRDLPAAHLLMLLIGLVSSYFTMPQVARMLLGDTADPRIVASYRASVVEAARRIFAP